MTPTTKTVLVASGVMTTMVVAGVIIRWRMRLNSENVDNEAFALVEAEKESVSHSAKRPVTQAEKLASLHPVVREKIDRMIAKAGQQGINLFVVSAHRDEEEQNELYSRGRTQAELDKVGLNHVKAQPDKPKVTNARAGQSDHNVKRAADLVEKKGSKLLWDNDRWEQIGKIGESLGLKWGGRWKSFVDKPHFYDRGGKSVATLWQHYKSTGSYA